ncbi:MAG TPA: mandelate racemase/muconate lactonizing enzyme family protein [Bryobacteraceae bacterium]|nr:mandelate racemase/muconate lactonizing enzyme family protein [Bryobacteraceae bacterium]
MVDRRGFLALTLAPVRAVAEAVKPVKITGVELYPIRIPISKDEAEAGLHQHFLVVEIQTDAGVTGYSFAGPPPAQGDEIRRVLVGKNLFAVEQHLKNGLLRWGGVEHAVWDAIGRIAGQPVYRLLGGRANRVKAYVTCVWKGNLDQSQVSYREQAEQAVRLQKAGYQGMKIRAWRPNPMDDVEACKEIRRAVGPDFHIMFDRTAHVPREAGQGIWSYRTGLQVALGLEQAGAYWLEEPFAREDYETPARLASAVDILITGGEGYVGIDAFQQCLLHRTYDILQPEGRGSGGILNCRRVAFLAEAYNVPCILHGTMSLMLAGWLQASFAIGSEWQEVALVTPPLLPEQQWAPGLKVLNSKNMYEIERGEILAPEIPGIGLDVNPDALKQYRVRS